MRAMILAAGDGTRPSPHTLETPKVLLPLAGKPLLEHTINWLKGHGIRQITINPCPQIHEVTILPKTVNLSDDRCLGMPLLGVGQHNYDYVWYVWLG